MSDPAESAVSLSRAARELRVSAGTVRRWLRAGAPGASPGEVGRGHGAQIVVADLVAWRGSHGQITHAVAAGADCVLDRVACALWNAYMRDGGHGEAAHKALGISDRRAAALLVVAYQRIAREVTGAEPERLPAQIEHLWTISLG